MSYEKLFERNVDFAVANSPRTRTLTCDNQSIQVSTSISSKYRTTEDMGIKNVKEIEVTFSLSKLVAPISLPEARKSVQLNGEDYYVADIYADINLNNETDYEGKIITLKLERV